MAEVYKGQQADKKGNTTQTTYATWNEDVEQKQNMIKNKTSRQDGTKLPKLHIKWNDQH